MVSLTYRRYVTSVAAIAVLTAGAGVAVVTLIPHPAHAATVRVSVPDVSLTPGNAPAIVSTEVAVRPGASDVPRVYPLSAPFRSRTVSA